MKINTFNVNREELERLLNLSMQATIISLIEDGVLNKEQADKYLESHTTIVLIKQSLWGKFLDKLYPKDSREITDDSLYVKAIKWEKVN